MTESRSRGCVAAHGILILTACLLASIGAAHAAATAPGRVGPQIEFPRASSDGPVETVGETAMRTMVSLEGAGPIGLLGTAPAPNNQSETSIASSGAMVVVGFNDFGSVTASFSGSMYSADGGNNFVYGGPLPVTAGTFVNGDPSLTVWNPPSGPPVFYYSSLFTNLAGQNSLCIHRSTDGGATWQGPFEVTPAPSGSDFPDREWVGVDPETGRLFVSWTHFGSGITMRVAYSDNAATGNPPTWTGPALVGTRSYDGQCSFIQPDPAGPNVYLVWESYPSTGSGDAAVSFARSTDNGLSWGAPADVRYFWHHIAPYGFERWLWSVTGSALNPVDGGIEVVYAASQNGTTTGDLGDVYFIRSANQGTTWSAPKTLDVFPGTDRPQCFPTVAADPSGAIHAYWYDLSPGSGLDDWTDLMHAYSTDFGVTWSSPVPTTPSPFHNEAGNNFGYPHQGDYIDATLATGGGAQSAFAWMNEPNPLGSGADAMVSSTATTQFTPLRLRPGAALVADRGCTADDGRLVAGEHGFLTVPLENIGRFSLAGVTGTLTSLTANATVLSATQGYGTVASGATGNNANPFVLELGSAYPCGQPIRLRLTFSTSTPGNAPNYLEFTLPTGVPISTTTLLSENFDSVSPPALPAAWSAVNQCGTCPVVPWVTDNATSTSAPNSAYVPESPSTIFSRLQGPVVSIPSNADYVEVRFDLLTQLTQYDDRYAPSGASFEYQLDGVGGSRFATSDAEEFQYRYTHNIARSSGAGNGDRSGWSGTTPGFVPVRIRIPGLGGHTFRPRFDLTTAGTAPVGGVRVDNVVIEAVDLGCGSCTPVSVIANGSVPGPMLELLGPNPFTTETRFRYSVPSTSHVRLEAFSIAGQRVRTLVDGMRAAGSYTESLRSSADHRLRPGVYLVRLDAGGERRALRVVVTE
jgi:hypothetical protein